MEITTDEFREEMAERLIEWETCVLDFEQQPTDPTIINNLFRVVHTVKGVAGTCGYTTIMSIAHELESYLDDVRKNKVEVASTFIDSLLKAQDLIHRLTNESPTCQKYTTEISAILTQVSPVFQNKTEITKDRQPASPPHFIRMDTIPLLRQAALEALSKKEEYLLNLSEVKEIDSEGVNFICSLVPVFVRSGISLTVTGISDVVINTAFSLGIDIRNVLKRASLGVIDPKRGRISHFTITLHPASEIFDFEKFDISIVLFQKNLLKTGYFSEHSTSIEGAKRSRTLLLSTTSSRSEIECELEKLPEDILWTISLTPDSAQKNDALKQIQATSPTGTEIKRLVTRWNDRLERICELAESTGGDLLVAVRELQDIQAKLRAVTPELDDLPHSVFREAMKTIRGE